METENIIMVAKGYEEEGLENCSLVGEGFNHARWKSSTDLLYSNVYIYPQWLSGKESACNAGDATDAGSIPGLGRLPGAGNGNPLQYSCLENPMDRGAWWATVLGYAKSQT